ncbi:GGDEF domain-containing protein, partial [Pseudomonas aeruginosa]
GDLFGRIGGEEFAVLLPGCDEQTARQIGERLQREVQRLRFQEGEHSFGITVSQGLTVLQADDEGLGALYSRADAAMYSAKRQGKDCIVVG